MVLKGSFETMKSIIKNQFVLLENDVLRLKALVAINCVNSIKTNGINTQLNDLSFFYLREYNRLMEVIGLSEFAELIGWDKKKLATYVNKGTPLWTIGQIEYFNLILKNRKLFKMRGDWNTPNVNYPVDYFEEFKIINNFIN